MKTRLLTRFCKAASRLQPAPAKRPHLRAFGLACMSLLGLGTGGIVSVQRLENEMMRELLATPFPEKNQGMFVQREAFRRPDVLPVYGSSELTVEMKLRADEFFREKPTGFQICPVGAGGNTTLMMAQKIAAQGTAISGEKVAVVLSPVWFCEKRPRVDQVAGNFSPLQAIEFLRAPWMSDELRDRFTTRMLHFKGSFKKQPLVFEYVRQLHSGDESGLREFFLNCRVSAYCKLLQIEDHLDTLTAAFSHGLWDNEWESKPEDIRWNVMTRQVKKQAMLEAGAAELTQPILLRDGPRDAEFLAAMEESEEWEDFDLLLTTLKSLHAKALVVSIPMAGRAFNERGISLAARDQYYRCIESMCAAANVECETFAKHDLDIEFVVGATTHLTPKGWLFVNRLLNEFYHGRLDEDAL